MSKRGSTHNHIPLLPALGADKNNISVSGLSSGGFMTTQIHVAYSKYFMGAGVLAAGPFYCSGSYETNNFMINAETTCMNPIMSFMGPDGKKLYRTAKVFAEKGEIDHLDHLKNDRVYIFTGASDNTVKSSVVKQVKEFYKAAGIPEKHIKFGQNQAGHAILTDNLYDHECSITKPPYINHSGFFQSHELLKQIYEHDCKLNPPAKESSGKTINFNQHEFIEQQLPKGLKEADYKKQRDQLIKLSSMSELGFVYIPPNLDKDKARIHIALHGCEQGYVVIGSDYFKTTGYNEMAATNNMIVLYPQVQPSETEPFNPKGCWDFWGYSSPNPWEPNFYTKNAVQMKAIIGMVDRLLSSKRH